VQQQYGKPENKKSPTKLDMSTTPPTESKIIYALSDVQVTNTKVDSRIQEKQIRRLQVNVQREIGGIPTNHHMDLQSPKNRIKSLEQETIQRKIDYGKHNIPRTNSLNYAPTRLTKLRDRTASHTHIYPLCGDQQPYGTRDITIQIHWMQRTLQYKSKKNVKRQIQVKENQELQKTRNYKK
jgi:hypothetical protein